MNAYQRCNGQIDGGIADPKLFDALANLLSRETLNVGRKKEGLEFKARQRNDVEMRLTARQALLPAAC
jgi:hypothetical protein